MMTYKVIRTTDFLEKGDEFTENVDGTFTCNATEASKNVTVKTTITISGSRMRKLASQGIAIPVVQVDERIESAVAELDRLIDQYQSDINTTLDTYKTGSISEMQKAEAITVLSNLLKLATCIKATLKENK